MPTDTLTRTVTLDKVWPDPNQPRKVFDEQGIADLAASIHEVGLLQAITVRADDDGQFVIVFGERRWRAMKLLVQQRKLPADFELVGTDIIGDQDSDPGYLAVVQLIENLQRVDLDPIEEARGYLRCVEEFGLKQQDLVKRVGRSAAHISKRIAILALPDDLLAKVTEGTVSLEVAYSLTRVKDAKERARLAKLAVNGRLQSYYVGNALSAEERAEGVAKFNAEIAKRMLTIVDQLPGEYADYDRKGGFNVTTIGEYVPAKGDVLVRTNDHYVTVYRKLTKAQLARQEAADEAETAAELAARNPWEVWSDAREDANEAHRQECRAIHAARAATLVTQITDMAAKSLGRIILDTICQTPVSVPQYSGQARTLANFAGVEIASTYCTAEELTSIGDYVNATPLRRLQAWVLTHDTTLFDQIEELMPMPAEPDHGIEPWFDDATETWVTDRPEPGDEPIPEPEVNPDQPDVPLEPGEADAIKAELEAQRAESAA